MNPAFMMFLRIILPPLPWLLDAPMSARDLGLKKGSQVWGAGLFLDPVVGLSASRTSASTASAPLALTIIGLISISMISLRLTINLDRAVIASATVLEIRRSLAAEALQEGCPAQAIEHGKGGRDGQGRKFEGRITEDLGEDPADACQDHRAEDRVAPGAEDKLYPGWCHLLDK